MDVGTHGGFRPLRILRLDGANQFLVLPRTSDEILPAVACKGLVDQRDLHDSDQ